jgi:hypothetical protein
MNTMIFMKRKGIQKMATQDEIGREYKRLKAGGMSGNEAVAAINTKFGTNLKPGTVRSYASRSETLEGSETPDKATAPPKARIEPKPNIDEMTEERVRAVAEEVCRAVFSTINTDHNDKIESEERMRGIAEEVYRSEVKKLNTDHISMNDDERADFPPMPDVDMGREGQKRKGRKETRDYRPITITLDQVLFDRAEAEARRRGIKVSKVVEAALWVRFGRPTLSYMKADKDESSGE